jgi:hypothetical protein
MVYRIAEDEYGRTVVWDGGSGFECPTVAEVISAATVEFPGKSLAALEISAKGFDAEILELREKRAK